MSAERREAIAAGVIAAGAIASFAFFPSPTAMWWVFAPSMLIAYACHLGSTARHAPDPTRVLPVYLIALAWQFVHFAEEFMNGFHRRWTADIFGDPAMSAEFFVWANMLSYAAFAMGALAMYQQWRIRVPMFVVWFFTIMGVMGNAVSHAVYVLITGDVGFPGFFTSLAYWIIGPVLIHRLWSSTRAAARARSQPAPTERAPSGPGVGV